MVSSSPRLTCALASITALLLHAPAASASSCDDVPAAAWSPERSWPSSCELDVPIDGYVLLEGDAQPSGSGAAAGGTLEVAVQRVSAGAVVETFTGSVEAIGPTAALFRSDRPFAPHAEYILVARRVAGSDGMPAVPFTSAFSTGSASLPALAFRDGVELSVEQFEKKLKRCTEDACGATRCEPTGEMAQARLVRVAVPPLEGGLAQRPYAVSAELRVNGGDQAPAVATSDSVATQAGKRSFITVELPPLTNAAEACITLQAKDVAGHEARLEAGCVALAPDAAPAVAAPAPAEAATPSAGAPSAPSEPASPALAVVGGASETTTVVESVDALGLREGFDDVAADGASEGCSVASSGRGLSHFAWLALALTIVRARARRRSAH